MSDQDFRERVLSALDRLEQKNEQFDQKFERLDQKFDQKFERLDQKFDQRFESMEARMGLLEQGVSWIRGKIEGKAEVSATLVSRIAVGTAIVSTIIALFALLK
ncbi:MAG: hypothetical protein OXL96_26180 [Candidatus Poribacteria bacterium]|nr:hypothetical protein [Candidatus Poribacteria bacterium]